MFDPHKPRCLLITPLSFYSFHRIISAGLERRGYDVELLNEEYPANSWGKVMGKIALPLLRYTTLHGLKNRLEGRPKYDLILIIKGRGLSKSALIFLKSRARRIVGYNFDSFDFNPSPRDWHTLVDRYATFDIDDAEKTGLPLVHLFSAAPSAVNRSERRFDISIIQRVHSDRLVYAERLIKAVPTNMKSFVFLYESSRLTFLLGLLRQPGLYCRMWRHISFQPLPYAEALELIGSSRVTFDFAHPRQSGITIRCFEAQSMGVAILTNNTAVLKSGVFPSHAVACFTPEASPEELRGQIEHLTQRSPIAQIRDIDDFLNDLLKDNAPVSVEHNK